MFFKEFFKNKWNITLLGLSLLSLIPFIVLVRDVLDLLRIKDVANVNEVLIHDVLTRTLLYTPNLIAFIIGVCIWASAATVSAIAISKKKINTSFGLISLFLGGIAIHIIVILIYWIVSMVRSKDKEVKHKKGKMIVGLSCVTASAVVPIAAIVYPLATSSFDDAYEGKPIQISFDAKNPNLIEIFSDGLDRSYQDELRAMGEFKDFTYFDKFQTVGPVTDRSVPSIYDDFSKNNPFARALIAGFKTEAEYTFNTYTQNFFDSSMAHMRKNEASFGQRTVVNPILFHHGKTDNYGAATSGDPKQMVEVDPTLNVTNWSGARDSVFGKWGVSNLSPDRNSYKWMNNSFVPAESGNKGVRVLMADLITHRPFLNNVSGAFNLNETSWEESKRATFNSFAEAVNALKALKNPDTNSNIKTAYDNTMIIIYGDHSSHETEYNEGNERSNTVRKTEALLMVKYPNQTVGSVISDRYLYAGQINGIINDYFTNALVNNTNPLDYFKSSKFDNVNRPTFLWNDRYTMATWEHDSVWEGNNPSATDEEKLRHFKLVPQAQANGEFDVVIDRQNLSKQVEELNKDKDHYE